MMEINLVRSSAVLTNTGVCFCVVGPAGVPGTGPAELRDAAVVRGRLPAAVHTVLHEEGGHAGGGSALTV